MSALKLGISSESDRPTALYSVSEYGEFFSLIDIAMLLRDKLDLHPVFLFKDDYGALDVHTRILERLNCSWATALTLTMQFDARGIDPGESDYVPWNVLHRKQRTRALGSVERGGAEREGRDSVIDRILFVWLGGFLPFLEYLSWREERKALKEQKPFRRTKLFLRAHYRKRMHIVSKIIDDFNPQIVIAGQDYPLSVTTIAADAAWKRAVKTVIIPFSMTPTTKEIAESFFGSRTNEVRSRFFRRFYSKRLKKWLQIYRGRMYTRLSLREVITSNSLGLTPRQPWTPNSGRGIIFAPSQQGYEYGLSADIPQKQLLLTGAVWSDRLLEQADTVKQRREALLRDILVFETYARNVARSRTVPRRPDPVKVEAADKAGCILIFSWPPNQSPRRPNGLNSFEQLNKALAEMLIALAMSAPVKLAISLHPTLVDTPLGAELKSAGLYVIDKQLLNVIDCADIFCAPVSSTLLWTAQLGTPSVNFDIYSYGYHEFVDAGMSEATTIAALRDELLRLIENEAYRLQASTRIIQERDYWTFSDGGARGRILQAVKDLLHRGTRKPSGDSNTDSPPEAQDITPPQL